MTPIMHRTRHGTIGFRRQTRREAIIATAWYVGWRVGAAVAVVSLAWAVVVGSL